MKKKFLAASLLTALTSSSIYSQTNEHIVGKANVPFAFQVGSSPMPAGPYVVSENGIILTVRAATGKKAVMVITTPTVLDGPVKKSSLEFNRYGDTYFLSKLWTSELQHGRRLPKSRQEKIVARTAKPAPPDEIAFEKVTLPRNQR